MPAWIVEDDLLKRVLHEERLKTLASVAASLRDYPNGGGDQDIMALVDGIVRREVQRYNEPYIKALAERAIYQPISFILNN